MECRPHLEKTRLAIGQIDVTSMDPATRRNVRAVTVQLPRGHLVAIKRAHETVQSRHRDFESSEVVYDAGGPGLDASDASRSLRAHVMWNSK